MQNIETQIQNETPETGAEYLRRLAGDTREAGQSATAFDIEAAADKIDQQAAEIETLRDKAARADAAAIRSAFIAARSATSSRGHSRAARANRRARTSPF